MDPEVPAAAPTGAQPPAGAPPAVTDPAGAPPAATPVVTEFTAPWKDVQGVYKIGEGDAAKPWWEGIQEEDIRQYAEAKQYANPEEAIRAAWSANKMNKMSEDIQAFLKGEANEEQEARVFKQLGRPDAPEAYELKPAEGVEVDPTLDAVARGIFHKLGLNNAKAQATYDQWNEAMGEVEKAYEAQQTAALEALKTKWGPDLEANRVAGNQAVRALGLSNEAVAAIEAASGSAAVVELMAMIGKRLGEAPLKGAGSSGTDPNDPANMTPEQAKARIAALQSDQTFQAKYTNSTHPEHKQALQTMEKLFAKGG